MAATTLADELFIAVDPAGAPGASSLHIDDPTLPTGRENLVQRAVDLVRERTGRDEPLAITLRKRIPHGAGMGGGSADAAATLHALNDLLDLGIDRAELAEWGARLGSDVPFFLHGAVGVCRGRGEVVEPWPDVTVSVPLVVLFPSVAIATPKVFGALRAAAWPPAAGHVESGTGLVPGDVFDAANPTGIRVGALRNDLEDAARAVEPALDRVFAATDDVAPGRRMLTGSGSAVVFFVAADEQASIAATLRQRNLGTVYSIRTLPGSAGVFARAEPPEDALTCVCGTSGGEKEGPA